MKIDFNFELSERELQILSKVIGSRSRHDVSRPRHGGNHYRHNDSRPRHNGNRAKVLYGGNRSDSDKKCFEEDRAETTRKIAECNERIERELKDVDHAIDRIIVAKNRMKSLAITQHRSIDDDRELY